MSQSGPEKKSANSLIALSSAAVLAVYTAGFMRTKAAAEHLEALEARVRPGMSAPQGETPVERPVFTPAIAEPVGVPPGALPSAPVAPVIAKVEAPKAVAPAPVATLPETKPEMKEEAAVVQPAASAVPEAPAPIPAPVPVATPVPVPPPPPPPVPAAPPQPTWKDGTYLGWGSARHGSIQASVEVTGGHIAVAKIEQCQMRYSCNVIERLIPQVAQRGNPEKIDYISGATESSNVFYWALIDALSKAK